MTYLTKNKARTTHTTTLTGEPASQYSRYETGVITGNYRDLPAIIADSSFDSINNGERWQVMNVFKGNGSYLDTVAIGGAMDADHAMQVMSTQLDSMGADYAKLVMLDSGSQFDSTSGGDAIEDWSLDAIGKLMNNPSQDKHYLPVITAKELDIETHRVTFDSVQWGGSDSFTLKSHGGKDSNLYLDMVRHDSRHELVNALDIASEMQALGAEEDSFDALMEVKSRLPLLKDRLFNAMSRSSIDDLSVTNVTETKPFKRQGVSNIAFMFDLSDGQKVSIWFHNPDSTPAKLMPSDIMISWKWMLNKRDVTAALSPKNGDNVQLPTLAKRIMRVAAKNSARFKSAQARKIQVDEELNQAQKDFDEKTAIVIGLDEKIESLNKQIEDATKAPVTKKNTASTMDVFKAGDNVVWRSMGSEISRGVFSKYIGEGAERRGIFVDDGGNMNAPASELFFDEDVEVTPEQQEALAASNTYNEVEVVIESLSSGARKFNEWSMTKDSVAALPNEQFLRLSDKLARVRMYSAEQLLNAYRTGRDDLIGMAQTIKDNEASAGETTPEINKRRDNLWKVIQAELNLTVPTGDRAAIQPMASNKRVIEGKTNNAKTPKGTKIASKFALVDAKYVIASHNATGSKNPKYPQELQPRDRGRETSIAWVQKTAKELDPESLGRTSRVDTGAPIVGDDLVVESGNGRTMAIKLAYKEGNAEEYREWLMENGDMFGFTANQVAKFKEPILVRIRTSEISREAFAVEANQDDKLSFTASELAKSDAKRITDGMLELFTPNDNGDLLSASNQPFIRAFLDSLGATEAAQYSDSNGQPTQALAARMKAAVFSKAYNDDRLLEMMADQTNPESQNMINALSMAAGKFVEAQANSRSQSLDISDGIINAVEQSLNDKVKSAIVDASNILSNAKRNNQDVAEYVTQMGLFEDVDPATAELAVFLANNSRSAKKMAEYFKAMAGFVDQQAKHSQTLDMFGDPEPLSLSDVMNHAKAVTSGNDLFSEDNMPAAQPEPIKNEPNTTFSERISEIESIVNGGDFNPADVSTDELDQIAIAVKDDAELINRVQAITENYVKAMARVAIAGMTKLAGGM